MTPKPTIRLYTAETRPDLWDALQNVEHPLNRAWPRFLDNDLSQRHFADNLLQYHGLRKFQLAIVEQENAAGPEVIVACGRSIPFFWPELQAIQSVNDLAESEGILQSLPAGGWDTIVSRGIRQYLMQKGLPISYLPVLTTDQENDLAQPCQTTQKPNVLSALSITVRADRRRLGHAELLIEAMKRIAREENLRLLVAPLRPTRKSEFPWVAIEEYIAWPQGEFPGMSNDGDRLPFDPWLRKHIRLGGRIARIAPSSMIVQGSFAEWRTWTGIDVWDLLKSARPEQLKREPKSNVLYMEVSLPGGLVPLRVDVQEAKCTYVEPNVWLYHQI